MKNRATGSFLVFLYLMVCFGCDDPGVEQNAFQGQPPAYWIQQLDPDQSSSNRIAAIKALGAIGPEARAAVPALIECLKEDELKSMAILTLGAIGPEARAALPELIAALEDGDANVRSRAAAAISRMGPEAIPQLVAAVQEDKDKIEPHRIDDTWFDELVRNQPSLVICGLVILGLAFLFTLLQVTRLWIRHRERVARINRGMDPDREVLSGEVEEKG